MADSNDQQQYLHTPAVAGERPGHVVTRHPSGELVGFRAAGAELTAANAQYGGRFETMGEAGFPIRNRAIAQVGSAEQVQLVPLAAPHPFEADRGGPERRELPAVGPLYHERRRGACPECDAQREQHVTLPPALPPGTDVIA